MVGKGSKSPKSSKTKKSSTRAKRSSVSKSSKIDTQLNSLLSKPLTKKSKSKAMEVDIDSLGNKNKTIAKDLMTQMDESIGLPPLPGVGDSKDKVGSEELEHTSHISSAKDLDVHKPDFFDKLLKEEEKDVEKAMKSAPAPKVPKLRRSKSTVEDKKINEDVEGDDILTSIKRDAEKFNELHKEALGVSIDEVFDKGDSIDLEMSDSKTDSKTDLKDPLPNAGANTKFSKEEPYDEYKDKLKKNEVKNDEKLKSNEGKIALPPADESYKLEGKVKKKGFFSKLFGSKDDVSEVKDVTSMKIPKQKVLKVNPKDYIGVVDNNTLPDIADGKNPPIEKEVPTKKDFDNLPSVKAEKPAIVEKPAIIDSPKPQTSAASSIEDDIASGMSMPTLYSEEGVSSVNKEIPVAASSENVQDDKSDKMENSDKIGESKPNQDSSKEVQDDSLTEKSSEGSGEDDASSKFIEDHQVKKDDVVDKNSSAHHAEAQASRKLHVLEKSISKLEEKRSSLESTITGLKQEHADLDTKIKNLAHKEKLLDKREKELLEREDMLLNLQTEIIRERKDLDEREFNLYVEQEKSNLSPGEPPKMRIPLREGQDIPQGMSSGREKLEKLMNAVTSLTTKKQFQDAMVAYNRLVEEYHATDLVPEEKWHLNLAIKELYHDLHILMSGTSPETDSGNKNPVAESN